MRILIVEDEVRLAEALAQIMAEQKYQVDQVHNGADGLDYALTAQYDVIVLDVMLPKLDGLEVARRLRSAHVSTPILMLTARDEISDKVKGLDCGADDYMTKPFNILEVKARIKTILRRMGAPREREESNTITVHDLSVNQDLRSVTLKGKEVNLTAKELDMLRLFITNRGKVYNREQLLEALWSNEYAGDLRTVDVHIRRLREKIEPTPSKPEYILTKWGVGYYFTDK